MKTIAETKTDEKLKSNKVVVEPSHDKQIQSNIKLRFSGFNCKLHTKGYKAEFLENLPAPLPLYDDIEGVNTGSYISCKREDGNDAFYSWFVPAKENGMPLLVVFPGYEAQLKSYPNVSHIFKSSFYFSARILNS